MGEIAEMHLDGTLCETCGVCLNGPAPGHPRYCRSCRTPRAPIAPQSTKTECPRCGKRVKRSGLKDHMRDAHPTKETTNV